MSELYEALQKGEPELAAIAHALAGEGADPARSPSDGVSHSQTGELALARSGGRYRTACANLAASSPVLPFDGTDARAAEQYRMIRTRVMQSTRQPKLIAVSSASAGDGKTVTSVNIAAAFSLSNAGPVLLVDGDFRRSKIASVLGIDAAPGLTDVLAGRCGMDEVIVQLEQFPNLFVAVAGKPLRNAAELLASPAWLAACDEFRKRFQFTIVDTPPIAAVADYELIQAAMDGVVLVVRPDHSRRAICLESIKSVPKNQLLGVVLNCVDDWLLWRNREYYYSEYAD